MASGKEIQVRFRVSNLSIVGRKSIRCTVRMDEQREGERERGEAGSSATIDLLIIRLALDRVPSRIAKIYSQLSRRSNNEIPFENVRYIDASSEDTRNPLNARVFSFFDSY